MCQEIPPGLGINRLLTSNNLKIFIGQESKSEKFPSTVGELNDHSTDESLYSKVYLL